MTRRHTALALTLGLSAAALLQGCMLDSPTYITEVSAQTAADGGTASGSTNPASNPGADAGGAPCGTDDFDKPDINTLTACTSPDGGHGHCFDKTKLPSAAATQLVACPDATQVCVPDEILSAGGGKLKTCVVAAMSNAPGACVTATLFPEAIKQGGSALKPDVCDSTQLCMPCLNPMANMAPTGYCEAIGVHKNACNGAGAASDSGTAPPGAATCCTTNGHTSGTCIPESVVPAAQRAQTPQDTCAAANKCIPTAFANNAPVNCDVGFLYGSKGVCMDRCFNGMLSFAGNVGLLSQVTCGSTELCIPCAWVSGQGVPSCP